MAITSCCLLPVLLAVGLQLSTGSAQRFTPRSIDEVLVNANAKVGRSLGADEFLDGLDMVVSRKQRAKLYSNVESRSYGSNVRLWTDGRIPYEIVESDFDHEQREWIRRSMDNWERVTCLRFVRASSSDRNKVKIRGGSGCWAHLGMTGGTQIVNLNRNCFWKGLIEHELGHTIGMIHEHQRPNRDGYLRVDYYAVKSSFIDSVTKYGKSVGDKMGLKYDYDSVMHYSKTAFNKDYYSQTFYPRDPKYTDVLGSIPKPSYLDANYVNLMYNCAKNCDRRCSSDCHLTQGCGCQCKRDRAFEVPCRDDKSDCRDRAEQGNCNVNTVYMHTYCRRSCGICKTDGSEPKIICRDTDNRCPGWASSGECDSNPSSMHRNCPRSCGDCNDDPTYGGGCRDTKGSCRGDAEEGKCYTEVRDMLKNCTQSCDYCPRDLGKQPSRPSGCFEEDPGLCAYRKANGFCQKLYAIMVEDCPNACDNCDGSAVIPADCVDNDAQCKEWAYRGDCDTKPTFMESTCPRSCSTCPGLVKPDVCMDYDTDCESWADRGECDNNPTWMRKNCKKACRVCSGGGSSGGSSGNCRDDHSSCPDWARGDGCQRGSGYMYVNCKKSCNRC